MNLTQCLLYVGALAVFIVSIRWVDQKTLWLFGKISNLIYRKTGVDNYVIGIVVFVLAILASIASAYSSYQLALTESVAKIQEARKISSLFGVVFTGTIALFAIWSRKDLSAILQRWHDLNKENPVFFDRMAIFYRWWCVIAFFISLPFMRYWWGMLDTVLLSVGVMFWSCPPPDMEERMRRAWEHADQI